MTAPSELEPGVAEEGEVQAALRAHAVGALPGGEGEGRPDLVRDEPRLLIEPYFHDPEGNVLEVFWATGVKTWEPIQPNTLERPEQELLDLIRVPA